MPTAFPPPVNVSPLIRFGRYSMLLAGIGYGAFWQSRYTKKELALKDIKAKEKAERDARIAQEKAMRSAENDFVVVPNSITEEPYADYEKHESKQCPESPEISDIGGDTIDCDNKETSPSSMDGNTKLSNAEKSFNDNDSDTFMNEEEVKPLSNDDEASLSEDIKLKVDIVKNTLTKRPIVICDKANDLQSTYQSRTSIFEEPPITSIENRNTLDNISSVGSALKDIQSSHTSRSNLPFEEKISENLAPARRLGNISERELKMCIENNNSVSGLLQEDKEFEQTNSLQNSSFDSESIQSLHSFIARPFFFYLYKLLGNSKENGPFVNITGETSDGTNFEEFLFSLGPY